MELQFNAPRRGVGGKHFIADDGASMTGHLGDVGPLAATSE